MPHQFPCFTQPIPTYAPPIPISNLHIFGPQNDPRSNQKASTLENIAPRSATSPLDAAGKLLIPNVRQYFAPV